MAEPMEQPNYVLQFKEGSYVPKHESRTPLYKVEIHGVTEATFYKYNVTIQNHPYSKMKLG